MFNPIRLAILNDSTVIFADIYNHAIRTISSDGEVTTLAGGPDKQCYQDGLIKEAKFNGPHGVAVREDGVIAVAEATNNTIRLLTPSVINGNTTYTVSTLAGTAGKNGMLDGDNKNALFGSPHSIVWGHNGELFVADIGNSRIRMIYKGETTTIAGRDEKGRDDGDLQTGTLDNPIDIVLDNQENLWIADGGTLTIRKWNKDEGLTTPFPTVEITMPHGISVKDNDYVVIADIYGNKILLFDIKSGQVSTVCGTGEKGIGNGKLSEPAAVLVKNNKIWIADLGNNRIINVDIPDIK
jgi:DNA-binding beta-propeller fold protein YncE